MTNQIGMMKRFQMYGSKASKLEEKNTGEGKEERETMSIILLRMQELANHSGKALIVFAGIDTPPYESGQFVGSNRKITKRGSSALRKVGYETMRCIKTHPRPDDPVYQKFNNEKQFQKFARNLLTFLSRFYCFWTLCPEAERRVYEIFTTSAVCYTIAGIQTGNNKSGGTYE
jgi:hypothetical protein